MKTNKQALFFAFVIISVYCWADDNKDKGAAPPPASLYWTGDGGRGQSITILPPRGVRLAENQAYLPDFVANELLSNFKDFSAMTLFDRVNNQRQYDELLSGVYPDDDKASMGLGHDPSTDYMLLGDITRTSTGYALQLMVNSNDNKTTVATFSQTISIAELDNLTGVRRAALDLLQKMGVQLTERARTELTRAATADRVNAQTALAQGITAQRGGTVVKALTYYYEATAFDPTLLEAANRASVLTATITSGNIGESVRNDIQRRNEWIKILQEANNFYKQHHPFEIIYDPTLIQGRINYNNNTVELSFRIVALPMPSAFNVINNLCQGLFNTGKSEEWGLHLWPFYIKNDPTGFPGLWPLTSWYSILRINTETIKINTELKNQNGKTIGTATTDITFIDRGQINLPRSGRLYMPERMVQGVTFYGVKADDITDNLSVSIVSVDGISAKDIARRGYMRISTGILPP